MALLVMLNNYMHDLATGIFTVAAVTAFYMLRLHDPDAQAVTDLLRGVARAVWKAGVLAFVFVLLLGGVRAATYIDYEWAEAAGHDQVTVLAIKHVILGSLTALGLVFLIRARQRFLRVPEHR